MKTKFFMRGRNIHTITISDTGMDVRNSYRPHEVRKLDKSWVTFPDCVCLLYDVYSAIGAYPHRRGNGYFIANDYHGRIEMFNIEERICTIAPEHPRMVMRVEKKDTYTQFMYVDPNGEIEDSEPFVVWYNLRELLETLSK